MRNLQELVPQYVRAREQAQSVAVSPKGISQQQTSGTIPRMLHRSNNHQEAGTRKSVYAGPHNRTTEASEAKDVTARSISVPDIGEREREKKIQCVSPTLRPQAIKNCSPSSLLARG